MNAAVIVHRWFERGADWAFAPEVQPMLLDIIKALDERQKSGRQGTFEIAVPGQGYLLGEIIRDSESLDPKARHRQPTMLRAVFLKHPAQKQDAARLRERLTAVWPTCPGADSNLTLVDAGIISPGSRSVSRSAMIKVAARRSRRKTVTMTSLGAISLVVVVCVLLQHSSPRRPTEDLKSLEPIAVAMNTQLSGWGHSLKAARPELVIQAYFGFLCQSAVWTDAPNSSHPYVEFIKRLPQQPFHPTHDQWTEEELNGDLRELASSLEGKKLNANDKSTPDECLQRIDELMNYDSWRKLHRDLDRDIPRFAAVPDPKIIDFVEHFRNNTSISPDLKEAADQMRARLKRWNVAVDENATPLDVFHKFFLTLQRPAFMDGCKESDKEYAYWKFLDRLPGKSSSLGWTCDDADQLKVALQDLLRHIGGTRKDQMVGGLIEAISDQMDYDKWLVEEGRNARTDGSPESKELKDYVKHFRGGTGDLGQEPPKQTTGPNIP